MCHTCVEMDFIDLLSIFLPALAFFSVLVILFMNLYTKLRPNKFISVNCWFCNEWFKISRELLNFWHCPSCKQYNGFTKDGDYNKLIPEQHDEFLNKVLPPVTANKAQISDNGFCSTCNNNQQLKVQQLAMFSPVEENNFDEEVERYQKQLDRAYRLCPQCENTLKKCLEKEKSILLGIKLSTIRQQGFSVLDLNASSSGISKTAKKKFFLTAIRYTTIILATIRVIQILKTCDFSHKNIINALPGTIVPFALLFRDIVFLLCNSGTSLLESAQYLTYTPEVIKIINSVSSNNIKYDPNFVLLTVGLFLQTVYLFFSMHLFDIAKCVVWLTMLLLSENLQLFEIIFCIFIIFCPSSTQKTVKITKCTFKNESAEEETKCDNVLNSTFRSDLDTTEIKNAFNVTPTEFNFTHSMMPSKNEFVHVFGKNPLLFSYRSGESSAESYSTKKSVINDSLNSSYYENLSKENSPNKSTEQDWFKGLNDLHLSSPKKYTGDEMPAAFKVSSPILQRPKPILSPPKLSNVTQSSWAAGGYWKNDFFKGSYSNLSRSSSQSSGFGSQGSHQPNFDNFNSLPSSRTNSMCGEFDRFSVLSEPGYYAQNRFYPNLQPDQQLFICPNPKSTYMTQKCPKSPTSFVLNDNLNPPAFILNSSFSNQNFSSPPSINSNPFYSNTTAFGVKNIRPLSVNSNTSNFSQYQKGSLLQKWRERVNH